MIKELREKKGLTQSELAKKLHLSESHVSRMERKVKGYRASYSTIKLLSKELEECPIKIFLFFANIDCKYTKLNVELGNNTKCEFENCFIDGFNALQTNIQKKIIRLKLENALLKRQLKFQKRKKKNALSAYRNRNTKFHN